LNGEEGTKILEVAEVQEALRPELLAPRRSYAFTTMDQERLIVRIVQIFPVIKLSFSISHSRSFALISISFYRVKNSII